MNNQIHKMLIHLPFINTSLNRTKAEVYKAVDNDTVNTQCRYMSSTVRLDSVKWINILIKGR